MLPTYASSFILVLLGTSTRNVREFVPITGFNFQLERHFYFELDQKGGREMTGSGKYSVGLWFLSL